jgi:hypothetical protein
MENKIVKVGIDAEALSNFRAFPALLFHQQCRHLSALISGFPDVSFVFYVKNTSSESDLRSVFPQKNLEFRSAGQDGQSELSLYHMPDQMTLIDSRSPPLLFAPRTVALSVWVNNLLAVCDAERFLKRWPENIIRLYLQAMEMITASPAQLFCPNGFEKYLSQHLLSLPDRQVSSLDCPGALPLNFTFDDFRWHNLKPRLGLSGPFLIVPSDLMTLEAESKVLTFLAELSEIAPDLKVVRPAFRNFVAAYLPAPEPAIMPKNVVVEPALDYFEFLELLYRSAGMLLVGDTNCSAGVAEARSLELPIYLSSNKQFSGKKIENPSELYASIKDSEKPKSSAAQLIERCNDRWSECAKVTMDLWSKQIEACNP